MSWDDYSCHFLLHVRWKETDRRKRKKKKETYDTLGHIGAQRLFLIAQVASATPEYKNATHAGT